MPGAAGPSRPPTTVLRPCRDGICGPTFACAPCFRYTVFISGQKTLREALISKSVDFADRLNTYSSRFVPERTKGKFLTSLCPVVCQSCIVEL